MKSDCGALATTTPLIASASAKDLVDTAVSAGRVMAKDIKLVIVPRSSDSAHCRLVAAGRVTGRTNYCG